MSDDTPDTTPGRNDPAAQAGSGPAKPNEPALFLEKQLERENPSLPADLRKSLARLGAAIAQQEAAKPPASQPEPTKAAQLPLWGEEYRAAPNAVFRSALFPALHPTLKEDRRYMDQEEIFAVSGVKVSFTGKQFDQSDLDVYLEILNMARIQPLGMPVKFSAHTLLKALGLPTGGSNHTRLHSVLIRLCAGVIDASDHGKRYFGQLLYGGRRNEFTMNYEIRINPEFALLFGSATWGKLDLKTRRSLGRKDVAKVLHAYYSTHLAPGFHDLDTLYGLTGLKGANRKRDILKAHDALKEVGFCEGYELNEAGTGIRLVNMVQHPSQQAALAKQTAKDKPATGTKPRRPKPKPKPPEE